LNAKSITAWLLFGGFVITVLATFLPFATVSVNVFDPPQSVGRIGEGGTGFAQEV
jgi:hypothetical protein